jgi:hypothetical protein
MENNQPDVLQTYFGVLTKKETYLNVVFLLLAFPLGLIYFISLVVGFSVGISLLIIWVGFFILVLLFPAIWYAIAFERIQAIHLLKEDIPPMAKPKGTDQRMIDKIKAFFTNPVTWKGLAYLFLKFPIGIIEFTMLVTGLSVTLGFLAAPFIFPFVEINFGLWIVDSFSEAIGLFVVGILLFPAILHFFNLICKINGKFAKLMLGQTEFNNVQPEQQQHARLPLTETNVEPVVSDSGSNEEIL